MNYWKRILRTLVGGVIFAAGTVIVMSSGLGYSSWDVLHAGISYRTGILIGDVSIIVSFVLILMDFLLKESVGLGTFLSMLACGKAVDLFRLFIPEFRFSHYLLAYPSMLGGMFICAFGAYYYMSAGLGTGARDGIMVAIRRHLKIPIGVSRFALEAIAALVGWLLGGPVGPATFIMAATMGFAVQVVFKLMRFETVRMEHDDLRDSFKKAKNAILSRNSKGG